MSPHSSAVTLPSEPRRRGEGGQTPKEQLPSPLEAGKDTQSHEWTPEGRALGWAFLQWRLGV